MSYCSIKKDWKYLSNIKDIYWVGPRRSDLIGIEHLFSGAVVIMGNESSLDSFHCISLEHECNKRINHNDKIHYNTIISFFNRTLLELQKSNHKIMFLWYGNLNNELDPSIIENSPFSNDIYLTDLLSDKLKTRLIFSTDMSVVPSIVRPTRKCNYNSLLKLFPNHKKFVLQDTCGAGGFSTFILRSEKDDCLLKEIEGEQCLSSVFMDNSIPINSHIMIQSNQVLSLPLSVQILKESKNRLLYIGGDFAAGNSLSLRIRSQVEIVNQYIGNLLRELGYIGVVGVDYLVAADGEIYFVEINPRFQASTGALNQQL